MSRLDWYDYGARFYDPSLGRFMTVDPMTEKFSHQSPYVYADNDPIRFIDFMGMNADEYVFYNDQLVYYNPTDEPDVVYEAELTFREDESHPAGVRLGFELKKVEMSAEEIDSKMDANGYKKVTKEETVVETDVTTIYGDAEGAPNITTNTTLNDVLDVKTMYTRKSDVLTDTKTKDLARLDDQPQTLGGKILKALLSPGVSIEQYRRNKTYTYGNNKRQSNVGAINTMLKIVNLGQGLYFNNKEVQRLMKENN